MALGREFVVAEAGRRKSPQFQISVAELGVVEACIQAGISNIQVLAALPHSSLYKAASAVGIGRDSIILLPLTEDEPWRFNIVALRQYLSNGSASIISISAGEVWTGRFATNGEEMAQIRALANQYGAWVHIDGGTPSIFLDIAPVFHFLFGQLSGFRHWSYPKQKLTIISTKAFPPFISPIPSPEMPINS